MSTPRAWPRADHEKAPNRQQVPAKLRGPGRGPVRGGCHSYPWSLYPVKSKPKHSSSGGGAEWTKFLSLAFVACPVVAFLMICIYGFVVWFGQILFWGPPA